LLSRSLCNYLPALQNNPPEHAKDKNVTKRNCAWQFAGILAGYFGAQRGDILISLIFSAPAQCGVIPPLFLQLAPGGCRTRSILKMTCNCVSDCNTGSNFA